MARQRIFPLLIGGFVLPVVFSIMLPSCEERREKEESIEEPIIARVNGNPLFKRHFDLFLPENYQDVLTLEEKKQYLDRWITTELLYEEAIRSGLGVSPDIQVRLGQYKRDLIADRLVQKVVREKAVVSEEEVRAYYLAHENEYVEEMRVSHVLVSTPEEAEKVKGLLKTKSFAWVARRYSIDKHAGRGGDLGYLSKGNMIPEFEKVVFNMKVGEVSDIIESEFGYHIIKLTATRKARTKLGLDDVKEEIVNKLMMKKRESVYDSLVAELRSRAEIEIFDSEIILETSRFSADSGYSVSEIPLGVR